jgi:two-component system phosphate regulon sensor histidine kinase PhoR
VLRTGERRATEVEIRHLRRFFALTGVPFPDSERRPHGAVLTFHDVTERRRLDRIRRDFVANASHELRTPLTSIRGFVEALEDGALEDPPVAQRFLGKIRTHADRMAALVQDLLDLSRLESAERPPVWEGLRPADVATEVVAAFAEPSERKRILIEVRDEGAPAVLTDGERLRRICENLVDNAVKYTPEGGHVAVVTRPADGGGAVLEVRDDGPGIPAEHLPRIFERFYRVDKARSRELGGTGLGLAIVRHLAESMGATASVVSEWGRGATFTIRLPSEPARAAPKEPTTT